MHSRNKLKIGQTNRWSATNKPFVPHCIVEVNNSVYEVVRKYKITHDSIRVGNKIGKNDIEWQSKDKVIIYWNLKKFNETNECMKN